MTLENLSDIIGLTIKEDKNNKVVTFLAFLLTYTENDQFNISFNAPSSTDKSYIPLELSTLFPKKDVMKIAYCSPKAFFHDKGEYDTDFEGYIVDLSRKIIIFMDQQNTQLL
ncbi:hypothetical protein GF312_03980 [Candidatus Poribacteria bacterium]|nr:hypothetical protein [Candidatus Poribacteria bacterium]